MVFIYNVTVRKAEGDCVLNELAISFLRAYFFFYLPLQHLVINL